MILNRPVGFELEFSGNRIDALNTKMVEHGCDVSPLRSYRHSTGNQWDIKTDASCGWEVATPKITTTASLAHAAKVASLITEVGGRINNSCGFHVHVDASGLTTEDREDLVRFGSRYEKAFFHLAPSRVGNTYCRGVSDVQIRSIKRQSADSWSKYTWLNIGEPGAKTVEFRLMEGTLDQNHIAGTALFFSHLVDWIVKGKKVSWGVAKEENAREAFQTFLGQGGFYGPYADRNKPSLKVARQWALTRFCKHFNEETRIKVPTVDQIGAL